MATIYIDNHPYVVKDGQNLLAACLSLGFNIPYFCWHPAMHSVGACRQCAVKVFKDDKDTRGRIVMSCMTPATDGTRLSIDDAEVRQFRKSIIELLMVNHPHDCPVCDEGGECHLQDMTVMAGHNTRRYRLTKRTHRNQDLGPFVNHEMNRCIACYRCVRFYCNYAGGRDFGAFRSRDSVFFGRSEGGLLESEFSGNLVEVCPTGVFTDKTFKQHYSRKWDLQTAPSICVHCSVGCNTIPGERYGELRRIRARYHHEVNGYFLCDRGRYGYEFVNSDRRIVQPLLRKSRGGAAEPVSRDAALRRVAELFHEPGRAIGIGSPRASLEGNFALRTLVGADRFFSGLSEQENRLVSLALKTLRSGPARSPSLLDIEGSDAAFILGEDLTNSAPLMALSLRQAITRRNFQIAKDLKINDWDDSAVRQAVQQDKHPLFIAASVPTRLDELAAGLYPGAPDDLARLGFAVAHAIRSDAPAASDLPATAQTLAQTISQALLAAERPVIIAGITSGSEAIIQAAANVSAALCAAGKPAALAFVFPECNSFGLGLMGAPGLEAARKLIETARIDTAILLENDLYRRTDVATADALLAVEHVVVIDHLMNATAAKAEVLFPAATFAESKGTLVNNEGRAQRFLTVFPVKPPIQSGWRWLRDVMAKVSRPQSKAWGAWGTLDSVGEALAHALPVFAPVPQVAPPANFRIAGQKIPRLPHRYSGRTAMNAHIDVHEQQTPTDSDSPLSFSMEGHPAAPPPSLISRVWAPGWNSGQAINKFQIEMNGPLKGGDPGKRLVEAVKTDAPTYLGSPPAPFHPKQGEWLVVATSHIFGTEELSVLTPSIAGLAPAPYIALHPEDGASLQANEGDPVEFVAGGLRRTATLRLTTSIPRGVAGVPLGLATLPGIRPLERIQVKKAVSS